MNNVHLVQCCFAANIEKTIGPYEDEETAVAVADAIEAHFYGGGDQHVRVETREVIEDE